MSDADTSVTHHLMRVRIRTQTFERLQEIAAVESKRAQNYTSVSDLVRAALTDYITVHDTTNKLAALQNDPVRRPVG